MLAPVRHLLTRLVSPHLSPSQQGAASSLTDKVGALLLLGVGASLIYYFQRPKPSLQLYDPIARQV